MRVRKRSGEHILTDITNQDVRTLDNALSLLYDKKERELAKERPGTQEHGWIMEELASIQAILSIVLHMRGHECEGRTCDFPDEYQDADHVLNLHKEYLRKVELSNRLMAKTYSELMAKGLE